MNDHPYMPLYFGDLLKQTLYWSGEERALLILLWAAQWWNGPLPTDLAALARAIQYDEGTFLALWNGRICSLFVDTPAGLIHQELETRRRYVERVSGTRRAAGKASGKARRTRDRRGDLSPDSGDVSEQPALVVLEQNGEQDDRTEPPTNRGARARTPIQSNPIQSRPSPEPSISGTPPVEPHSAASSLPFEPDPPPAATATTRENGRGKSAPRRRRMPPDHPTEHLRDWSRENTPRVNFDAELAMLRDHEFHDAHSDWDAVVRNWLRRAAKQTSRGGGGEDEHLTRFERHKRRLYGA